MKSAEQSNRKVNYQREVRNPTQDYSFVLPNKKAQETIGTIIEEIEVGTNVTLLVLKNEISERDLFFTGLQYVVTTKKALCQALNIPIEAGCRYKRYFEKIRKTNKIFA